MRRQREVFGLLLAVSRNGALALAPTVSRQSTSFFSPVIVGARRAYCVEDSKRLSTAVTLNMNSADSGKSSERLERTMTITTDAGGTTRLGKSDMASSILTRLAKLSLRDYEWRSSVFKTTQADRRVEESLARMLGQDAAYVRPMDASDDTIGPLGRSERTLVRWLTSVIEEEGARAKRIASHDGALVRPLDLADDNDHTGPLSALERSALNFLTSIRDSESERVNTFTLRPKDLHSTKRGPLGDAEANVVAAFHALGTSELLRHQQSKHRGGQLVRPIDVPGPLGEMERKWVELVQAERRRAKDSTTIHAGKWIRPKDATLRGPLGDAERQALEALELLKQEETQRLKSIRRVLERNRPMDHDRYSLLGMIEALLVGLLQTLQLLLVEVYNQVEKELPPKIQKSNPTDNVSLLESKDN